MSLLRTVLGGKEAPASRLASLVGVIPRPSIRIGISFEWPWSWSGLLRAAPKKRTSHQKKRQRQLAGNNQQKPLRNLNRCPACGHVKRAHTLCMNCVQEIRRGWRQQDRIDTEARRDPTKYYDETLLDEPDTSFDYPKRVNRPSSYDEKLADRERYVLKRPRTLLATPSKPKEKKLPMIVRRPYEK